MPQTKGKQRNITMKRLKKLPVEYVLQQFRVFII